MEGTPVRPIILQPLVRKQIRALLRADGDVLAEALVRLATADHPELLLDLYMPGGIGPVAYHGVVHAGDQAATETAPGISAGEWSTLGTSPPLVRRLLFLWGPEPEMLTTTRPRTERAGTARA